MKKMKKNNEAKALKKGKKKKKLIPYSNVEFFYNVMSILIVMGIGIYFGGRSFYYYSKLNSNFAAAASTLNGTIINTTYVVTDGDGLHQDTDGYYYKGNIENNYVKYGNRYFRIIRINNDGSVKVITDDIVTEFMWGEAADYQKSNLQGWLNKTIDDNLTGIYYDTLPYPNDFLVKTDYNVPTFDGSSVVNGKDTYSDYVTTLSVKDYSNANGKNSFLNIKKYFWILGTDKDNQNLYVDENGALLPGNLYESYGVRAVITLKPDSVIASGNGTKQDPYTIDQGDKTNYVDSYIKLGNDVWKVYSQYGKEIKAVHLNYVGEDQNRVYSDSTSFFDIDDDENIAWYLNRILGPGLPYYNQLQEFATFTGEVSGDTSLDYKNNYKNFTMAKIGLLNLFDYHNIDLDDYYLCNTTSSVGSLVDIYHNYGLLEEANVEDVKKIVVTTSISSDILKVGDGTLSNPYRMG
ncbi:MAG: hypothetical protein IJ193_07430 [Bacilli bacterium]|nr:hypothetical protein [Bacilli bacterium]